MADAAVNSQWMEVMSATAATAQRKGQADPHGHAAGVPSLHGSSRSDEKVDA